MSIDIVMNIFITNVSLISMFYNKSIGDILRPHQKVLPIKNQQVTFLSDINNLVLYKHIMVHTHTRTHAHIHTHVYILHKCMFN